MSVEIVHAYPYGQPAPHEQLIESCIQAVLAHLGVTTPVDVTVMLVDDANIQKINRETRQIDKATDVLSFPLLDFDANEPGGPLRAGAGDIDPETGAVLLGDIVISLDAVKRQAEAYGHSAERELGYLTVHGMLHLLGYDHMQDEDKTKMRGVEEAVMDVLRLPR